MNDVSGDAMKERVAVEAILRTVAVFDVFDTPLTPLELWRYLVASAGASSEEAEKSEEIVSEQLPSFSEVCTLVPSHPVLVKTLEMHDGYIALSGRARVLVEKRHAGARFAIGHWRVLTKWQRRFAVVPFLQLFSACNVLAIDKVHAQSDIDVFMVARSGRLWLVRFWMNILALLTGDRITDDHRAEKLCLSFNVTERALSMKPLLLEGGDPYFLFWTVFVRPLLGDETYEQFWEENSSWVQGVLPHAHAIDVSLAFWGSGFTGASRWRDRVRRGCERLLAGRFGDACERLVKRRQLGHLRAQGRGGTQGTRVVVSDDILKFHSKDRRAELREAIDRRMRDVVAGAV